MSDQGPAEPRDDKGRFLPGNSGNGGRKRGARAKLGEQFVSDLMDDWERHGKGTIELVRAEKPDVYLKVVASILPKELNVKVSELDELSDADVDRRIAAITKAIVEAGAGDPLGGESQEAEPQPSGPIPPLH